MSIIRGPRPDSNFYILDKKISEDKRLSWSGRGLLIYLLGKPNHWQVSVQALVNETKASAKPTGRDATWGLLKELIDAGYCTRTQVRKADGTLGEMDYLISENAKLHPGTAEPGTAEPGTAEPGTANPTQVSIEPVLRIEPEQTLKKKEEEASEILFDGMKFENLPEEQIALWQQACPAVNVTGEILRAAVWLNANPKNPKNLKSNYKRFLAGWMTRAQDKAPAQGYAPAAQRLQAPRPQAESFAERDERARRARWEEMTGEKWPDSAPPARGDFIDVQATDVRRLA